MCVGHQVRGRVGAARREVLQNIKTALRIQGDNNTQASPNCRKVAVLPHIQRGKTRHCKNLYFYPNLMELEQQ